MCGAIVSTRSATIITSAPLKGFRILNPRPRHQAAELSHRIQTAGGIAVELPTIEIQALSLNWLTTLPSLSQTTYAIFVSTNAVHHFFSGLQTRPLRWPESIQTYAIGQGTAKALHQYQIQNIQIPEFADSEHLLALPRLQVIQGQTILLVSGEKSRPLIKTTLEDRGAQVHPIKVYRRARPQKNLSLTHALWQDDAVDIILMLSQEAIDNLFHLFEEDAQTWLQSKPWIVISPRLVELAHQRQVKTVVLSSYRDILTTLTRLRHDHGR